jgi:hypothetical protein
MSGIDHAAYRLARQSAAALGAVLRYAAALFA